MKTVMLYDFINQNQGEIIQRCKEKSANRGTSPKRTSESNHGIPKFLEHVTTALLSKDLIQTDDEKHIYFSNSGLLHDAARHGAELLQQGHTIEQAVQKYGDVCQAVTELALEQELVITTDDYHIFNYCLDVATAECVSTYGNTISEGLDTVRNELAHLIDKALLTHEAIRTGNVSLNGPTGILLLETLKQLKQLTLRDAEIRQPLKTVQQ